MSQKTKAARAWKHKKATYNLTGEQLDALEDRLKEEALKEAMPQAFVVMLALSVMVIEGSFGQLIRASDYGGVKRAELFTNKVFDLWDDFGKGDITLDDCIRYLKEECGIDVVKEGQKH